MWTNPSSRLQRIPRGEHNRFTQARRCTSGQVGGGDSPPTKLDTIISILNSMDGRFASLETGQRDIRVDVKDIRGDVQDIRGDIKRMEKKRITTNLHVQVDQIAAGMGHKLELYHKDFFYHYLKGAGLSISRMDIKVGVTFPLDKGESMVEVDLLADTSDFVFAAEVTSHLEVDEVSKVERFIKIFNHIRAAKMEKRAFGFFCAMVVDPAILTRVNELLEANGITLIQGIAMVKKNIHNTE